MRSSQIVGVIALVWLLIGVLAVWQRGYFNTSIPSCGAAADIALTIAAGPLNYLGVNPEVGECRLPQPSQ